MSIDELVRSFAYVVMIPGLSLVGVFVWNSQVMSPSLRRPVALMLWLQACIYTLFMVGLLLLRLWEPSRMCLLLNTTLIISQAVTVWVVIFQVHRFRINRIVGLVVLAVVALFIGGNR